MGKIVKTHLLRKKWWRRRTPWVHHFRECGQNSTEKEMSLASTWPKTCQFYKKFQEDHAEKKIWTKNGPDNWCIWQQKKKMLDIQGTDEQQWWEVTSTRSHPVFLSQREGKIWVYIYSNFQLQVLQNKYWISFIIKVPKNGAKASAFSSQAIIVAFRILQPWRHLNYWEKHLPDQRL